MVVGELFVKLGIIGSDKVAKGFDLVKKQMSDVKTESLETKAAILGMVYGLEQLVSKSVAFGTMLENFSALTGISEKAGQQYIYAGRQKGLEAEEVLQTLSSIQSGMNKTLLGHGAPGGLELLTQLTNFDINKAGNALYTIQKVRELAIKTIGNEGVANEFLRTLAGDKAIAAMRRGAFSAHDLNSAPVLSDSELRKNAQIGVEFKNMFAQWDFFISQMNAQHGAGLISEIGETSKDLMELTKSLIELAEKVHVFQAIGLIFEGWNEIFKGWTKLIDLFGFVKDQVSNRGFFNAMDDMAKAGDDPNEKLKNKKTGTILDLIAPAMGGIAGSKNTTVNNNANVIVHNHEVKDMKDAGHHLKSAVKNAYRELPQSGGF